MFTFRKVFENKWTELTAVLSLKSTALQISYESAKLHLCLQNTHTELNNRWSLFKMNASQSRVFKSHRFSNSPKQTPFSNGHTSVVF